MSQLLHKVTPAPPTMTSAVSLALANTVPNRPTPMAASTVCVLRSIGQQERQHRAERCHQGDHEAVTEAVYDSEPSMHQQDRRPVREAIDRDGLGKLKDRQYYCADAVAPSEDLGPSAAGGWRRGGGCRHIGQCTDLSTHAGFDLRRDSIRLDEATLRGQPTRRFGQIAPQQPHKYAACRADQHDPSPAVDSQRCMWHEQP